MLRNGVVFDVKEVLDITGGTLISGRPDSAFQGINIDSRKVKGGELFVAIIGKRLDGHEFVPEAITRGAKGVLAQKPPFKPTGEVPVILVKDTTYALGELAHECRRRFHGKMIGITGSSGKTTTKEMVVNILEKRWKVHKTLGNLNNLIGLPLTLFDLTDKHEAAVVELGTNQPGEIARLAWIAHPSIACVTNVGPAHLEGLGSLEGVAQEKVAIFDYLGSNGTAVLNVDDLFLRPLRDKLNCQVVTFGRGPDAYVKTGDEIEINKSGTVFTLVIGGRTEKVALSIPGVHHVYNALAAAAIAHAAGVEMAEIVEGLQDFSPVAGRTEIISLANGVNLINDVYNANPASCRAAIDTLERLKGQAKGVLILGDMLELGPEAPNLHRDMGRMLTGSSLDKVYLRGELVKFVADGAREGGWGKEKLTFFEKVEEIIAGISDLVSAGDWILVKGSRGMKMEEIVERLVQQFGLAKRGES